MRQRARAQRNGKETHYGRTIHHSSGTDSRGHPSRQCRTANKGEDAPRNRGSTPF
ncbi:hypothetical protein XAPC_3455 [Xanthomonas citri pv. punicae str. LMG 859]|nr:hypothetical protein XAPC_3455 [Xanthomonas citri pv. punicae str. LMG 859]